MSAKKNTQLESLPEKWFKHIASQEIRSEEQYSILSDPNCSDWVGLKSLYGLVTRELNYYSNLEEYKPNQKLDPTPELATNTLKSRLLAVAISKSELLTFNEIRILNLLIDSDRKSVATMLGIKKSRLSQIIKNIRQKLEGYSR